MSNNKTTTNRVWNSQELINLSQSLGEAYLPGLDFNKSSKEADTWTMDKFIKMNQKSSQSQTERT